MDLNPDDTIVCKYMAKSNGVNFCIYFFSVGYTIIVTILNVERKKIQKYDM